MIKIIFLLVSVFISTEMLAETPTKQTQLFLVGGALKTCSSMSLRNCDASKLPEKFFNQSNKSSELYLVNAKKIALFGQISSGKFSSLHRDAVMQLLNDILFNEKNIQLTNMQLKKLFSNYDKNETIHSLSEYEYYLLLDILEVMAKDPTTNQRLKEKTLLSASNNYFSGELFKEFVARAGENNKTKHPKVLVITASARDTFAAVDFYLDVFSQVGADVNWLPLDATLQSIWQMSDIAEKCKNLNTYRLEIQGAVLRESIYPDLHEQQYQACLNQIAMVDKIKHADAIFINGGDQSLTVKAFKNNDGSDSIILKLIKDRVKNNKLLLGGTSAGASVMPGGIFAKSPIPMITGGKSNTAIVRGARDGHLSIALCETMTPCPDSLLADDLTYNAQGGLGLFQWGITDSHFSEQGRQGRLAKLVLDTSTRFAFGIDETTALIVSHSTSTPTTPYFEVLGQGGVLIVQNDTMISPNQTNKSYDRVTTHYLTREDQATILGEQLVFNIAPWKSSTNSVPITTTMKPTSEQLNIFQGDNYRRQVNLFCQAGNKQMAMQSLWKNHKNKLTLIKNQHSKSSAGHININNKKTSYCSYQNYELSIGE